jgi:dTDP-6-deoxy-L-talose 4-dehydrogenase (NAD+)
MRIAVTGASGFIGRHVLERLLAEPHEIVALSRSRHNVSVNDPRIQIIEAEMGDDAHGLYKRLGAPDVLIHLAWGGLPNYLAARHFEEELPRQYRFLKTLLAEGLPALVCTGTCLEYGMQSGNLAETQLGNPTTAYGFAKDALRRQLGFLQAELPFKLAWARLFYTYGAGQSPKSLYSQLQAAVASGARQFDMSAGEQLRDFLPVGQVADKLVRLATLQQDVGIVNVCSGQPVSIRSLVEGWVQDNHWDIQLNRHKLPLPSYEALAFWGDAGYLNALLAQHNT